jgi:hypothetical protein
MMTPKEKAAELVNRYFLSDIDIDWYDSVNCALIAVDEILDELQDTTEFNRIRCNYWQEVKQEIEKL